MDSEKQSDSVGGELREQEHQSGDTNADAQSGAIDGADVSESFGDISGHSESRRKSSKVKTKVKRKKKRLKGDGEAWGENAEDDVTDTETKPKKSKEKKMKKSASKKKKKKSDGDKDAEVSGKKKKTKRKKKSSKSASTNSEEVAPSESLHGQDAPLLHPGQSPVDTNESQENVYEENRAGSSHAFQGEDQLAEPPSGIDSASDIDSLELDSDSDDLPDPSDLDFDNSDDEETYGIDRTALSLSGHDIKPLNPLPISRNLFSNKLDDDSMDEDGYVSQTSSRSLGVSVPPQDITGSLARDLVDLEEEYPLDPSTHTILRRRRYLEDRKVWAIVLLSILLVVAIIVIIVLASGGGDENLAHLTTPTARPSFRPTPAPTLVSTPEPSQPTTSPTTAGSASTPSIDNTVELMNILGLSEEMDDAAYLAFQWISSEGWPLETVSHYWLQSRFSLACLYYNTNGSDWDNADNWISGSDVCEWFGVICNAGDEVEELDLEGNGLGATLPTQLGMITTMTQLYLASNNLQSKSLSSEIGNLLLLKTLDISNNEVTGAIPDDLALLTLLTSLTLNNNHFSGVITSHLGSISGLTVLQLDNNYLSGAIPTELAQLTMLQALTLHANMLTGNVPLDFQELLGNLDKVTFHSNDLTGDMDAVFCSSDINLVPSELTADCLTEVVCTCCTSCE